MKKHICIFVVFVFAAVLLIGCAAGKNTQTQPQQSVAAGSAAPESDEQAVEEKRPAEEKTDDSLRTYQCRFPGISFDIDFVEYPGVDSGEGMLESLDGMALAVGCYTDMTHFVCDVDIENCKDVTDIPEHLKECIEGSLDKANYCGSSLSAMVDQEVLIDNAENIGDVNGYELCQYKGRYIGERLSGDHAELNIAGYATFLKQNGYPVYTVVVDLTEDQSKGEQLDEIAYNCMTSLREP